MIQNFLHNSISKYAHIHMGAGIALVVVFLLSVIAISPNVAPEFSGSAHLQVVFQSEQHSDEVAAALSPLPYAVAAEPLSETAYRFTSRALGDKEYISLLSHITDTIGVHTITEYQSFSPSISRELIRKAVIALIIASIVIVLYISFVFRGVSYPLASWKYGTVAILALFHDVIAPLGVFALLAPFTDAAVDTLFVTALLATLGYSINDTIVVFDRIRDRLTDNAAKKRKEDFAAVIDRGVRTSFRRSVYTSLSTVIPLIFLVSFVPVVQWFGIALFVGVVAGTYSSLFFGPSLLLLWHRYVPQKEEKWQEKNDTEKAEEALRDTLRNSDVI